MSVSATQRRMELCLPTDVWVDRNREDEVLFLSIERTHACQPMLAIALRAA